MALGKREEQGLWIATSELPKSPGHPFYQKLNEVLAEADFDWAAFTRLARWRLAF